MARHSKSGVRGLFRRVRLLHPATGERLSKAAAEALLASDVRPVEAEAWEIDLRWTKMDTAGRMIPQRYSEQLPDGIKAAAARDHTLRILNAIKAGTFDPGAPAPVKLHKALDVYLAWAKVNRPKSYADRCTRVAALKAGLSDMALDALSPFAVEAYKRRRLSQPKQRGGGARAGEDPPTVQPATVNREVACLKHFCGLAVAETLEGVRMDRLVAAGIRDVPMLREPPGRVRHLTPDEERRLLAALPKSLRGIVQIADATGMRRSEVARLRRAQVDMHNREIVLTATKSNKVRRVPIAEALAPTLQAALDATRGEYLFPSPRVRPNQAERPLSPDGISRGFHRAVVRAGLSDLRFHDLRHDAATKMRRRGHGLDVIGKVLGHAHTSTTARYAHVEAAQVRAAVADVAPMAQPTAAEVDELRRRRKARKAGGGAAARGADERSIAGPAPIAGPFPGMARASGEI